MKKEIRVVIFLVYALVISTGLPAQAQTKFKDLKLPEIEKVDFAGYAK